MKAIQFCVVAVVALFFLGSTYADTQCATTTANVRDSACGNRIDTIDTGTQVEVTSTQQASCLGVNDWSQISYNGQSGWVASKFLQPCGGGGDGDGSDGGGGAIYGVDVSDPIKTSGWQCLKNSGYTFAVVRAFRSNGRVDANVNSNLLNAQALGFNTDVYMFPCPRCSASPEDQVRATLDNIHASYNTFWLDVEQASAYWFDSQSQNRDWITRAINAITSAGVNLGIYTNKNEWSTIPGVNWDGASQYPLWYAHYDKKDNFGDFKPFGGWTQPTIKQYNGDTTRCGIGLDENYKSN